MGPKKRKLSKFAARNRKKKVPKPDEESLFPLNRLPNEILFSIFNYLSPIDMLSMSDWGSERLSKLSLLAKNADFSQCQWIRSRDFELYFFRIDKTYITEINFNFLYYISSHQIVNSISLCKMLKNLSIIECGLNYFDIHSILQSCDKIEKFSWNVCISDNILDDICMTEMSKQCKFPLEKLKKVFLNANCQCVRCTCVLFDFINGCFSLNTFPEIYINFSSCFSSSFHQITNRTNILCIKLPATTQEFLVTIDTTHYMYIRDLMGKIFRFHNVKLRPLFFQIPPIKFLQRASGNHCDQKEKIDVTLPEWIGSHLQLQSKSGFISCPSSVPEKSIRSLILLLDGSVTSFSENILHVTGRKLKTLCLRPLPNPLLSDPKQRQRTSDDSHSAFAVDVMQKLFISCINITSLTVSELHFSVAFPFRALENLKELRALSIPLCVIDNKECRLQDIVQCTPNIRQFSLRSCQECKQKVEESELLFMKDWPNLRHLTLKCISSLKACHFLRNVDLCSNLEILELIAIGEPYSCSFMTSVICLLNQAKRLKFLRINQKVFNPSYSPFWKAIAVARNLEGLCIMTSKKACGGNLILNGIKKLKKFHLFHLFADVHPENLNEDIRKSMHANGIGNTRVQTSWPRHVQFVEMDLFTDCKFLHFESACCE